MSDDAAADADPEVPDDDVAPESAAVADEEVLDALFATIEDRKERLPEGSYTASLFTHEKGENAVLEKIGEEATETILAAKDDDVEELTAEAADLVYHLLVLFARKDLDVADLRTELRDRF
ncbi:phosphoribosyl-ATP diphosphatase [Halobaculum sp. WSA2]|uniref:Phosphoribosyl-ATP pyrophosphatase n=1 Tax=Halobaculum saliterrae TaxID=2073113 RepID=A0A6B0SUJ1_9EURY|nr:phosphoribosyl-ATP diphosphatase [Halobaculum saliterrae]